MKLEEKQLPEMTVPDLEIQNFNKEIETQTNSENELPLSENLNLEIKSEKDQTEKLKLSEQIEDLNKKMDEMKELFSKKILSIDFEKETADRLHKELQEYKNDIYFKLISNKTEYDEKESSEIISKINNLESKSPQYESFFNIKNLTFQNSNKINKFLNRKFLSSCKPCLSNFF